MRFNIKNPFVIFGGGVVSGVIVAPALGWTFIKVKNFFSSPTTTTNTNTDKSKAA